MNAQTRAVIYTRVSSDPHQQCRSVEQQEAECRAFCERQGWTVVDVYDDNDRSASRYAKRGRPKYIKLKEDLARKCADILVMWEGSRAQRDLADFVKLRDICADNGIGYSYSGRIYDLTRTDDRFTVGLDALLGEREASLTRDRVLRGARGGAQAGRPHGRLLYGYRRVYDHRGVFIRQDIHEAQAAVVREAAERVARGESCRRIAQDFNRRGIPAPSGGAWNLTQIRRMVTRPSYIAQRVYQGRVIGPGNWPAILDGRTFAECVARVTDPRRKTSRDSSVKHMLTGAAVCDVCGGRIQAQKTPGYVAYDCEVKFCIRVKAEDLDAFVSDVIVKRLGRPDAARLFADPEGLDEVELATSEAAEKRTRLQEFYAASARGEVSPAGLAAIEAQLLPEIEAADARATTARIPRAVREYARPDIGRIWPALPVATRREIIRTLLTVRVKRTRQGTKTFDPNRVEIVWKC